MTTSPEEKDEQAARASEPGEARRIQPGDLLSGKYRVEKVLGEGGMGQVLEAVHVGLDQRVAVKALLPQMLSHKEAVARFTREAKGLAKLNSEHVARVFDVGQVASGQPFMVMEFLEGKDLGDLVDTRGALPVDEAAELALHICAGLAEVHACGIIHRDLKPSNCYVVTRGDGTPCLKLLDFGISKFRGTAVTRTAAIMGSPGYMSPEQMASTKDVDERADIWGLGATFYEMVTGRPAFVAENAPMLCIKIANESPDPPRSVRADLPEGVEAVLLKCLAKLPEERYRNVAEVARAIAPFAPERARSYVEKIEGILRGARVAPASDRPPAKNLFERATVRAGDDQLPSRRPAQDDAADRETVAPGKRNGPPVLAVTDGVSEQGIDPAAPPAPKKRRTALFLLLGLLLGAGLAMVSFVLLRAQATSASATPTATPTSTPATTDLDASVDAGDEDDDDDDAGVEAGVGASKARSTPRKKPKPHPPRRPRHK